MSLIADALKTAQREKQKRESSAGPNISPVLVPLRANPPAGFDWRRTLTIAISSMVIVVALVVMMQRMRKTPSRSTLPPIPSPLAGTPLLSEPAPTTQSDSARAIREPAQDSTSRVAQLPAAGAARHQPTFGRSVPPRSERSIDAETTAVLQARSASTSTPPPGGLRIAVESSPESETARLFTQALTAHRKGDFRTARPIYERVLALDPDHADALNNLGVLLSAQQEYDRALELLRRAASIAPTNAGVWANIGAVLHEQRRASDATAAFQHALTIDPNHTGAKVGLAQQFLSAGSAIQARTLLESALASNSSLAEAHYALGQALELLGDKAGAVREFSAFIRFASPRLALYVERVRRHVDSLSLTP